MQKWEYLEATLDKMAIKRINGREIPDWKKVSIWDTLNRLGDEGWELVTVFYDYRYYFKRPKAG